MAGAHSVRLWHAGRPIGVGQPTRQLSPSSHAVYRAPRPPQPAQAPPPPPMIVPAPITAAEFEPYGSLMSHSGQLAGKPKSNANQGTATKLRAGATRCLLGPAAREPAWYLFRSFVPPRLRRELATAPTPDVLHHSVVVLEKHPFSSQTFVPVGQDSRPAYLVVVALPDAQGEPDLSTLRAFVCAGTHAVTYAPGIWHAPMIAAAPQDYVDFLSLIHELDDPQQPEVDCVERNYTPDQLQLAVYAHAQ
ncbi:AaceriAGR218Cp [[Ashbya] aceris (nom. inval.)]|nr:AaceriAGR218Cp [[Ashbya] aceris (nom. inval.)]